MTKATDTGEHVASSMVAGIRPLPPETHLWTCCSSPLPARSQHLLLPRRSTRQLVFTSVWALSFSRGYLRELPFQSSASSLLLHASPATGPRVLGTCITGAM